MVPWPFVDQSAALCFRDVVANKVVSLATNRPPETLVVEQGTDSSPGVMPVRRWMRLRVANRISVVRHPRANAELFLDPLPYDRGVFAPFSG
jgi:hypothetical protein